VRIRLLSTAACLLLACAEGGGDSSDGTSTDSSVAPDATGADLATDALFPLDETGDTTLPEVAAEVGPDTGCPPGEAFCGGKCIPTYNDVDNCGGCGTKCPDATNAARTCAASTCGFSCNAGKGDCDGIKSNGCETDVQSDTANCGACGKTCSARPNATATCSGGACSDACNSGFASLGSYCTNFGGGFETHASTCSTCNNGNPYASSACSCPAGFAASGSYLARNDACSALRPASIRFCETSGTGSAVYGGAYQIDDPVGCGAGCRVPNARTGGCSCPAGFSPTMLRVTIVNGCSGVIGSQIGVCVHPSAALDNFGGVYQVDDSVTGGLGCRAKNSRTGGCSCPSGFSATGLRTLVDAGGGEIGAHAYFCSR
jgi:hypothetical protein